MYTNTYIRPFELMVVANTYSVSPGQAPIRRVLYIYLIKAEVAEFRFDFRQPVGIVCAVPVTLSKDNGSLPQSVLAVLTRRFLV